MLQEVWNRLRDRRRTPRYRRPRLKLRIDGRTYRTVDWSLGGVRISDFAGPLHPLERLEGRLRVPGGPGGAIVAEVIWIGDDGDVGLRFLEIEPKLFLALSELPPTL